VQLSLTQNEDIFHALASDALMAVLDEAFTRGARSAALMIMNPHASAARANAGPNLASLLRITKFGVWSKGVPARSGRKNGPVTDSQPQAKISCARSRT
jgi:hypothetical protein